MKYSGVETRCLFMFHLFTIFGNTLALFELQHWLSSDDLMRL